MPWIAGQQGTSPIWRRKRLPPLATTRRSRHRHDCRRGRACGSTRADHDDTAGLSMKLASYRLPIAGPAPSVDRGGPGWPLQPAKSYHIGSAASAEGFWAPDRRAVRGVEHRYTQSQLADPSRACAPSVRASLGTSLIVQVLSASRSYSHGDDRDDADRAYVSQVARSGCVRSERVAARPSGLLSLKLLPPRAWAVFLGTGRHCHGRGSLQGRSFIAAGCCSPNPLLDWDPGGSARFTERSRAAAARASPALGVPRSCKRSRWFPGKRRQILYRRAWRSTVYGRRVKVRVDPGCAAPVGWSPCWSSGLAGDGALYGGPVPLPLPGVLIHKEPPSKCAARRSCPRMLALKFKGLRLAARLALLAVMTSTAWHDARLADAKLSTEGFLHRLRSSVLVGIMPACSGARRSSCTPLDH